MKRLLFTLVGIAVLAFVIPHQAKAEIIFSDFTSDDGYRNDNGWLIGGANHVELGWPFTPLGKSYTLDSIKVAPSYFSSGPNHITFSLMSDNGGKPDFILESFLFNNLQLLGQENHPVTSDSTIHPLLDMGHQYWLIAKRGDSTDTFVVWNQNNVTPVFTSRFAETLDGGNTWYISVNNSAITSAFEIDGKPLSTTPEPASMLLFGLGGIALGLFKKVKKSRAYQAFNIFYS